MLDSKFLRENLDTIETRLKTRGGAVDLSVFRQLDEKRRGLLKEAEALKEKRNKVSEEIGRLKKEKKDAETLIAGMQDVSAGIKNLDDNIKEAEKELEAFLLSIPNIPHETVPVGRDSTENPVIRTWGEPKDFGFSPLEHTEIGEMLGIMDFERAGKISGARFSILKGAGALLERALINFMLELHTKKHGYTEVWTPLMAKRECFLGTGQLPKFEEDLFKIDGWDHFLIPTAEVPVTNMHREEILGEDAMPVCYTAYTP
ncbi:MAG: serine--tRNA ligase, partial [Deltaproteobacteria bacterium]|nr:serine--tRNA ligase [Deltaproteobacteria bacterium]